MTEECSTQRLLKEDYYENCPGCEVEKYKEFQRGIPFRDLLNIWIVVITNGKKF